MHQGNYIPAYLGISRHISDPFFCSRASLAPAAGRGGKSIMSDDGGHVRLNHAGLFGIAGEDRDDRPFALGRARQREQRDDGGDEPLSTAFHDYGNVSTARVRHSDAAASVIAYVFHHHLDVVLQEMIEKQPRKRQVATYSEPGD